MRGRIYVTPGLVLSSWEYRETDKLSVIYTRDLGKVRARFIGVKRPHGKLKAMSEPMVLGEYRLHLRDGAEVGIAAGGMLTSSFPRLRRRLDRTLSGLEVLELLDRLTTFWKPNEDKFDLARETLLSLEKGGADWVVSAFALRLLESAGFGMGKRKVSEENRLLWDVLHNADIDEVARLPKDFKRHSRLERLIRATVERVTELPLHCAAMRDKLLTRESVSAAV